MPKKQSRVAPSLPMRLRRVRHTGDHFRNVTREWEEALRKYLDALADLNDFEGEDRKLR